MESIVIRPAVSRYEFEQACEIWGTVFPEPQSFFQKRLDFDKTYAIETTWLALVDGEIAAAMQIFPYKMHWGSAQLKVGGIGSVATRPEFRRRGLAQQILRRQTFYMRSKGYDLSLLLTGINPFYEQNDWFTIPVGELIAEVDSLERPASISYSIRICEETDLDQVKRMYDENQQDMVAPMVRTTEYWLGQREWRAVQPERFLIAEEAGQVAAYLRYKITNDNQLVIGDGGYMQGQDQALLSLLFNALEKEKKVSIIRAGLPANHPLSNYLQANGAKQVTNTEQMWKNVHLAGTLTKIVPELTRRIQQNSMEDMKLPVSLLVNVGKEEVLIHIRKESVEAVPVTESVDYHYAYDFNDKEWLTMLLKGYGALDDKERKGAAYLHAMFPEKPHVFWHVDNF
jgi:GNAT superfamily N-acetyltransferase